MSNRRKLIEVSLPLDEINRQSAREKSIRHGHPSTLHLWWARRPLAAARCVLFAQLVDDPSSRIDEFRDKYRAKGFTEDKVETLAEAEVTVERQRLHDLLADLANWDNLNNKKLWDTAREEIRKSCGDDPPAILDPFAGGGTIPVEAQRLGLEAHASDLNPVAVLINKAMIEIPPKFSGMPPVHPEAEGRIDGWHGSEGLTEDVRRYGKWINEEARKRIGHLYPRVTLNDGTKADPIAWVWARTITCPNPMCGITMPLVRSWWLGRKKGKAAYVIAKVTGKLVEFSIGTDPAQAPEQDGTMEGRGSARCLKCNTIAPAAYVKKFGNEVGFGSSLMATVTTKGRSRVYLPPTVEQARGAEDVQPSEGPRQALSYDPKNVWVPAYGLTTFGALFTKRQLMVLTTYTDLIEAVTDKVMRDYWNREPDAEEGQVRERANSIATLLALSVSRMTNKSSTIATWDSSPKMEAVRSVFARQAIPMTWDYAESNHLASSSGSFSAEVNRVALAIEKLPHSPVAGSARQLDAIDSVDGQYLISTDPPYYDNIAYSDLSDYFYVWLRQSLKGVYPELFRTLLVPKVEELVANPSRHGGRDGAKNFFEGGFKTVFQVARRHATPHYPITVYYAFKQAESNASGTASTGWETLLEGMVRGGWMVTATWPMRSELSNRMIASGTNALASSIVLALRPRAAEAAVIDRREFRDELLAELPARLRELQQGAIAPVDLAQAAIGPGMAVFSRHSRVLEPDGSSLSVRQALTMVNAVLDEVLSEQEGDHDPITRWCIRWFGQFGFNEREYGTAETLASAVNTSVSTVQRSGAVLSGSGKVKLLAPDDLAPGYRPDRDDVVTSWEVTLQAAAALDREGLDAASRIISLARDRVEPHTVKELAYLCFSLAEKAKDTKSAQLYNNLVTSWPEVTVNLSALEKAGTSLPAPLQESLDLEDEPWR